MQPPWKAVGRFPRKLNIELAHVPAIPLLGAYPDKTRPQNDAHTPMFTAALFTAAETRERPRCPPTGMDKEDVVRISKGTPLGHKKERNGAIYSNVDAIRGDQAK